MSRGQNAASVNSKVNMSLPSIETDNSTEQHNDYMAKIFN